MRENKGPNPYLIGAICLFVIGGLLMVMAVRSGEAEAGVFFIFPFVTGGGIFMGIGLLMVILGFLALVLGLMGRFTFVSMEEMGRMVGKRGTGSEKGKERRGDDGVEGPGPLKGVKGGAVVFIGPVPIVLGSDSKVTKSMLYVAVVLVIALGLLFLAMMARGF